MFTAKKNFSSLPPQLREIVLSKTDTDTRMKLFQINNKMRRWVLKEELFGDDLETIEMRHSQVWITPRYGYQREIDLTNKCVFKVVRRCKKFIFYSHDLDLTRIFPRLQSISHMTYRGTNFPRLSETFTGNNIQITGSCHLEPPYVVGVSWVEENFLQFVENHLKRCKTVHFIQYSFNKLDFFGTQHFPQAIFWALSRKEVFDFEGDLEKILMNGVPGRHPDSAIWMIIRDGGTGRQGDNLIRIISIISKKTLVVNEHEAIRKKFLVSYKKVRGRWVNGSRTSNRIDFAPLQFINDPDIAFSGLKTNFDEEQNLIFLVYPTEGTNEFNIHIKFDPIEK